jgi:hypothetical protein
MGNVTLLQLLIDLFQLFFQPRLFVGQRANNLEHMTKAISNEKETNSNEEMNYVNHVPTDDTA